MGLERERMNNGADKICDRIMDAYREGYAKAIDDFAGYMSEYIDNHGASDLIDRPYTRMLEIAEQLKEGDTECQEK